MILIDGVKYSCLECIRGHRTSACLHDQRPLLLVNRKGRPSILYPDGNKNYRIAVFAQEIAEESTESTDEKCRNRTVVILKASDKYVLDFKTGQIVGPYCEQKARAFEPGSFVNVSFCCLGSLAQKRCNCNQKKVSKKRILQSYLKKNQGKVDMEKIMNSKVNGTLHMNYFDTEEEKSADGSRNSRLKKEKVELEEEVDSSLNSRPSSNENQRLSPKNMKAGPLPSNKSSCSKKLSCCSNKANGFSKTEGSMQTSGPAHNSNASFINACSSFNNEPSASVPVQPTDDLLLGTYANNHSNLFIPDVKLERDFHHIDNAQNLPLDLSKSQFDDQNQLPSFQNPNIPKTSASNVFQTQTQYSRSSHRLGSQLQIRQQPRTIVPTNSLERVVSETFTNLDSEVSDSNILYYNSVNFAPTNSLNLEVNNGQIETFNKSDCSHHFDYAAAMHLQQEGVLNQQFGAPVNNDLLVDNRNQVFNVVNVPSCSVPGTCLCSDSCTCEKCETHNPSAKNEHSNPYISLSEPLGRQDTVHDLDLMFSQRVVHESKWQNLDYMGFLQLIITEGQEDNSTEDSRSDGFSGDQQGPELCSCAEGQCFCSNCERHGIIDGVRLDDFFGAAGNDHGIEG